MRLQVLYRLAVRLRVGINEVIQRFALLVRRKTDITAVREKNAINVVGAEREVALGGIFPGFRSIHRNPADAHEIEFGSAMVAGDVAFGLVFRKWKSDFKPRGNTGRAHHANEKRMEIRAVAPL